MTISSEEADRLAGLLNQICTVTMDALQGGDVAQRLAVAASLRQFRAQFDEGSEIGGFVEVLARWLEGERPGESALASLDSPFQRALETMLKEVAAPAPPRAAAERPPISGHVLAQLISAVVAAHAAGDETVQRELAAQLVNLQNRLDATWKGRLGPLLENLRRVLGGSDPRILPAISDPHYQNLWHNTVELLVSADLSAENAREQLLERLVHNTIFTRRSGSEELTQGFLRALLEVQRQAIESGSPAVATLVGAIRALLQGLDPTPFTLLLEGEELVAWEQILAATSEPAAND